MDDVNYFVFWFSFYYDFIFRKMILVTLSLLCFSAESRKYYDHDDNKDDQFFTFFTVNSHYLFILRPAYVILVFLFYSSWIPAKLTDTDGDVLDLSLGVGLAARHQQPQSASAYHQNCSAKPLQRPDMIRLCLCRYLLPGDNNIFTSAFSSFHFLSPYLSLNFAFKHHRLYGRRIHACTML